jgi:hypothetical protein
VSSPSAPGATTRAFALFAVKAVHSAIFLVLLGSILRFTADGWRGRRDRTTAIAAGLVAVEIGVFLANRGRCPLTGVAEDLGADDGRVSDIFLPETLARTLPVWSTAILLVGLAGHVRAALARRARR